MKLMGVAATMTMSSVMVVVILVPMMVNVAGDSSKSCIPQNMPHAEELVYYSDVVVLGEVVQTFPDPGHPQMYNVRMVVYCVYKGQQVPRMIEIGEAGNLTDKCPERQMEVSKVYMAFLYKHSTTRHTPAYLHQSDNYKDELFVLCDLNISLPIGDLPAGAKNVTCEDSKHDYESEVVEDEEENCIRFTPKPGDSPKRMKSAEPRNLSSKTEKVEVEGHRDGDDPSYGSALGPEDDSGHGPSDVSAALRLSSAVLLAAVVCVLVL